MQCQELDQLSNPIDSSVGAHVRQLRNEHDMSQSTLAEQLGITFQQVQKYEKGTNRVSASRLQHIAQIFRVEAAYFFDEKARGSSASKKNGATVPDHVAVAEFVAGAEGKTLARAFTQISDATLRRSIVRMVESTADHL